MPSLLAVAVACARKNKDEQLRHVCARTETNRITKTATLSADIYIDYITPNTRVLICSGEEHAQCRLST